MIRRLPLHRRPLLASMQASCKEPARVALCLCLAPRVPHSMAQLHMRTSQYKQHHSAWGKSTMLGTQASSWG